MTANSQSPTVDIPNSLENAMAEIASIVEKMEHETLPLEETLAQFERGIFLIRHSQKVLQETEQKVQILLQQNQTDTLSPFQLREEDSHS